jgi:hypothetical protein
VTYLGADHLIHTSLVRDGSPIFPAVHALLYTSADCSGLAFVESADFYPANEQVIDASTVYAVTGTATVIMPASQKVNGTCAAFQGTGTRSVISVTTVGPLSGSGINVPLSVH